MPGETESAVIAFEQGNTLSAAVLTAVLAAAFIAITLLQSGLDKAFNYKGNLEWLQGQFSKTFLRSTVGILLPVLMLGEIFSALLSAYGILIALLQHGTASLQMGLLSSGLVLLMLLFGQRVSKEYAGAASLTGYFLVVLAGLIALAFC